MQKLELAAKNKNKHTKHGVVIVDVMLGISSALAILSISWVVIGKIVARASLIADLQIFLDDASYLFNLVQHQYRKAYLSVCDKNIPLQTLSIEDAGTKLQFHYWQILQDQEQEQLLTETNMIRVSPTHKLVTGTRILISNCTTEKILQLESIRNYSKYQYLLTPNRQLELEKFKNSNFLVFVEQLAGYSSNDTNSTSSINTSSIYKYIDNRWQEIIRGPYQLKFAIDGNFLKIEFQNTDYLHNSMFKLKTFLHAPNLTL